MFIKALKIKCLRNVRYQEIQTDSQFNLLCGENGSGKTTVLEAIYLLSHGRSFRSRQLSNAITYHEPNFTIFAEVASDDHLNIALGVDKPKEGRELLDKAKGQKLFYHKFGTKQSEDLMLYQNPYQLCQLPLPL